MADQRRKTKEEKSKEEMDTEFGRLFQWGRRASNDAFGPGDASKKKRKLRRPKSPESEVNKSGSGFSVNSSICSTSKTSVIDSLTENKVGESDHENGTSNVPPVDTGEKNKVGESDHEIGNSNVPPVDTGENKVGESDHENGTSNVPPVDTREKNKVGESDDEIGTSNVPPVDTGEKDKVGESDLGTSNLPTGEVYTDGRSGRQPEIVHSEMKIPNNKVDLVFGKGGEMIINIQASSGADIQAMPLNLPFGDSSTETTVYMKGTLEQIECAKQLVKEAISEVGTDGRSGRKPEVVHTETEIPKDKVGDEPDFPKKLPLVNFSLGPSLNQDNTSTGDVGKGDGFSKYLLELDKAGIEVFGKLPVEVQCQLRESYDRVQDMKKYLIQKNQKLLAPYLPPVEVTQGDDFNSYLLEVYKAEVNRADINGFGGLPDEVQGLTRESHIQVQSFKNLLIKADRLTLARHLPPVALPPVVYRGDEEFIPL